MELGDLLVRRFGLEGVRELGGGHQSRVFEVLGSRPRRVLKVHDAAIVERARLEARSELVARLAARDHRVCGPEPFEDGLVAEVRADDGWRAWVTCQQWAQGQAPDPSHPEDAQRLGAALGALHRSMRDLGPCSLPPVAALVAADAGPTTDVQLLHGDFGVGNVRLAGDAVAIFDFDDCGCGPPAFDVANAVYMVRFDEAVGGAAPGTSQVFEAGFLAGYGRAAGRPVDPDELDRLVGVRVAALRAWLDDPASAPIGIRSASDEWRAVLRSVVRRWGSPGGS